MEERSQHGMYFIMLILLMVSVFILSTPLVLFYVSAPNMANYFITAIIAYLFGHLSARFIEKITHKEKKEVLAGTIIPLPTVIGISVFLVIADQIGKLTTLSSIYTSIIYFVCFNIPFLIYFYEHERHKHHLVGLFFAPMFLALVYTFTFMISTILASYSITPILAETASSGTEYTEVSKFVESCLKITAEQRLKQGYLSKADMESYIDINIHSCINNFKAFNTQDYTIEAGDFISDITIGNTTVGVKAFYPLTIKQGTKTKQISEFQLILEKEVQR